MGRGTCEFFGWKSHSWVKVEENMGYS